MRVAVCEKTQNSVITCYMEVRLDLSTSFANYNAYLCIYQYTFIISKKQFPVINNFAVA